MGWLLVVVAIVLIFWIGAAVYMMDQINASEMTDEDYWEDYDKS